MTLPFLVNIFDRSELNKLRKNIFANCWTRLKHFLTTSLKHKRSAGCYVDGTLFEMKLLYYKSWHGQVLSLRTTSDEKTWKNWSQTNIRDRLLITTLNNELLHCEQPLFCSKIRGEECKRERNTNEGFAYHIRKLTTSYGVALFLAFKRDCSQSDELLEPKTESVSTIFIQLQGWKHRSLYHFLVSRCKSARFQYVVFVFETYTRWFARKRHTRVSNAHTSYVPSRSSSKGFLGCAV